MAECNGYYNGQNIKSKISYYTPNPRLAKEIKSIHFESNVEPGSGPIASLFLKIFFIDGGVKCFSARPDSDGAFPKTVFEDLLKQADDYLTQWQLEPTGTIESI